MTTRSKTKGILSNPHCLTVVTTPSAFTEPLTYQEAFQTPAWTQAMHEKFQAPQTEHTWSLVPLPKNKHAIWCKWLFKLT